MTVSPPATWYGVSGSKKHWGTIHYIGTAPRRIKKRHGANATNRVYEGIVIRWIPPG